MDSDSTADAARPTDQIDGDRKQTLVLELDTFAWETLTEQSVELGVPIDELVAFSVQYYIADLDSNRIARTLPTELRRTAERN